MFRFLQTKVFWGWFLVIGLALGIFFWWELTALPRPAPNASEVGFSILIGFLLALDAGLLAWQQRYGSCPIGAKRATGTAGAIGAFTLLCPVCLLIPVSLFGISLSLTAAAPFLPLLRLIAMVLLGVTTWLLWPKDTKK